MAASGVGPLPVTAEMFELRENLTGEVATRVGVAYRGPHGLGSPGRSPRPEASLKLWTDRATEDDGQETIAAVDSSGGLVPVEGTHRAEAGAPQYAQGFPQLPTGPAHNHDPVSVLRGRLTGELTELIQGAAPRDHLVQQA